MPKQNARTLSGFMELLPEKQMYFEAMIKRLQESYSLYGFTPLDTPIIEAAEVLLAKGGGETEKQIYRLTKGDTDLALRFDLTVPLAKYVALHYGQLTFPFRRFQIGKVYRGERAQRGRFREFYQADIDIIGDEKLGLLNEAEIPAIIYHTFQSLGLREFIIRVNNRKVLNGLFLAFGIAEQSAQVMQTIDKLEKIGREKTLQILVDELKLDKKQGAQLLDLLSTSQADTGLRTALAGLMGKNALLDEGIEELLTLSAYMEAFGVPETHFQIDLTIARGLDYYTGTVYETIIPKNPEIGSICSGGRYDDLAEYYTDKKLPGVGISIGLTRLFYVLDEQNYLNDALQTAPADVLILPMTEDLAPSIQFATALRRAGMKTQIYGEEKKFKAKMNYANKLQIPFVVFIGEDEVTQGKVTIKDMQSGEQETLEPRVAAKKILAAIDGKRDLPPITIQ